jgi:alkylated DNA repair dioxygenase AlkB
MNLFPDEPARNPLLFDGIASYYGPILTSREAQDYLEALLTTIPWKNDEAVICGKHIVTARKVAWYGDSSYSYTYSGTTKVALPWTKELRALVMKGTTQTFWQHSVPRTAKITTPRITLTFRTIVLGEMSWI